MNIVRFSVHQSEKWGVIEGSIIKSFSGNPFAQIGSPSDRFQPDGDTYERDEIKLLVPCTPTKIICIGLNYKSHIEEIKHKAPHLNTPAKPTLFYKPTSAIIATEEKIVFPKSYERIEFEGEVGVVIGKHAKDVTEEKALEYILGYTCINDVSERGAQKADQHWVRAKGYDTFAPLGPSIQTDLAPDDIQMTTRVNGDIRQSFNTNDLLFEIPYLLSYISEIMTLLPGDVIATGTSSGTGMLNPGDTIEIKMETGGTLRNYVDG